MEFETTESAPIPDARGIGYLYSCGYSAVTLLVHNSYGNNSLLWVIVFIST